VEGAWRTPIWDPNSEYSLSWYWGTTSFSIDTSRYSGVTDSLALLFDPPAELAGKVGMFSSPTEVISLALAYLGKPQCNTNPDDLNELQDLLLKQKPSVKIYSSDAVLERMSSGETVISQDWNGDSLRSRLVRPSVKYVYPREGLVAWAETLSVPKSAKNPENAKKFIAFLLQPENAALQSNFVKYASTIKGAEKHYDADLQNAPELVIPADTKLVFSQTCGEQAIQFYDKIWTKLKN
jgi:spermidine/putrescine transport system substrate-binding protein